MDPVILVGFWAALFLATHLGVSSSAIRPRMVAAAGEAPYRGIYSLISFATLVPLIIVYFRNKHAGAILWNLRDVAPVRWLVWLMMLAAFILIVAGLINPSPASIAPVKARAPRGVLKITRHPSFVALSMFGLAHMLMNGFISDVLFFATFPMVGVLGGLHQDRRKLIELGERYRAFMAETSFIPGAALWQGRQRWTPADTPWLPIGIGSAVTVAILMFHQVLFGGNPLG